MKLNEFISKPIAEALQALELTETQIHTNPETGEIKCVELKYKPSAPDPEPPINPWSR